MPPTLLFVHGAWHTPEYWNAVKHALESKGYRCLAPEILYNYGPTPVSSMATVVEVLQEAIAVETSLGHDVVLVNHSMGGMAGTSAVKGFTKKDPSNLTSQSTGYVVGLIQLTAWMPDADEVSAAELAGGFARRHPDLPYIGVKAVVNEHGWSVLQGNPAEYFYTDMSEDEAQKWVAKLINFSAAIRGARDSVYAGWRDVPSWYLLCLKDMAIRIELQEEMVQRCREAGADIITRMCDTGHSPMATRSEETTTFIEGAVEAFESGGSL